MQIQKYDRGFQEGYSTMATTSHDALLVYDGRPAESNEQVFIE